MVTMDKQSFNHIVQGKKITPEELKSLEELSATFPYFQIPHILIAKEYVKQESALAEMKLRTAATYTSDRKNLKNFVLRQDKIKDENTTANTSENEVNEQLLREEIRNEEDPIHAVVDQLPEVKELITESLSGSEDKEQATVAPKENSPEEKQNPQTSASDSANESQEEVKKVYSAENKSNENPAVETNKKDPSSTNIQTEAPKPALPHKAPETLVVPQKESKVPFPVEIKRPEIVDEEPSEKQELRDDIQHELEILRKQKQAFDALIAKEEQAAANKKVDTTNETSSVKSEKPKAEEKSEKSTPFRITGDPKPEAATKKTESKITPENKKAETTPETVEKSITEDSASKKEKATNAAEVTESGKQKKAPKTKGKTTPAKKEVYKAPRTDTRLGYFVGKENENTGAEEKDSGADFILGYLDQIDRKRHHLFEEKEDVLSIIDDFIKKDPKISKPVKNTKQEDLSTESTKEKTFISENLAMINASQGNISKAISIYEQLLLKNPHKKSYFVAQIEKLKNQ